MRHGVEVNDEDGGGVDAQSAPIYSSSFDFATFKPHSLFFKKCGEKVFKIHLILTITVIMKNWRLQFHSMDFKINT